MLSVSNALETVLFQTLSGTVETVALANALHRVLAVDLLTPHDSPPFDKSLMDGFAVTTLAAADQELIRLAVIETVTAGMIPTKAVTASHAVRIMTGAILPANCDCVVPIERTQFDEATPDRVVIPRDAIFAEANLMRQGTAARQGSQLMAAGTQLQPQQIAALAEFGQSNVSVYRKPTVAVLATGDELIPYDQPLRPGAIRNSNEPMLMAQAATCGACPVSLGVARDTVAELSVRIQQGLELDVLLLSGGVSAGTLDLVPQQLAAAGVEQIFHGVDMKPGKPLWFGIRRHESRTTLVFGLPGNPVSSLVCFELFVRPALEKISGITGQHQRGLVARLSQPFAVKGSRPVYQPAVISVHEGQLLVRPVAWNGSSDLKATVEANGMALMTSIHGGYTAGELVPVWFWGDGRIG
ncbi:MAG: molybdopterin molybdotransferase MoeA [Fuerstia sp.]|nr:molybdopterin molybdotransferase MoeA [Fuerstiella sp.]